MNRFTPPPAKPLGDLVVIEIGSDVAARCAASRR